MKDLDFSEALNLLKDNQKVSRAGWNGKNMWIKLQRPTDLSKMSREYIYMKTVNDELVPWVASQTDLLANDWELNYERD